VQEPAFHASNREKLNAVQWIGFGIFAVGLVDILITGSDRHLGLFSIVTSATICLDLILRRRKSKIALPSIMGPQEPPKPKTRSEYNVILIAIFIPLLAGCFTIRNHVRVTALLWLSSMVIAVLARYFYIGWSNEEQVPTS
jgi:hypothetical protein